MLSHALCGFAADSLSLFGVTGTNGKTTTTHMLAHMLGGVDDKVGLVGTAGHYLPTGRIQPDITTPTTTPPVTTLDKYFLAMKDGGSKYAVLELSNFGLSRGRLIGYKFDGVAVINITHCHHIKLEGSFDNYKESKLKAIDLVKDDGTVVLNIDDENYSEANDRAKGKQVLTFGKTKGDIFIKKYNPTLRGSNSTLSVLGEDLTVEIPLPGVENVLNATAAIALLAEENIDYKTLSKRLSSLKPIPGRWNWIDCGQPFTVVVDKANIDTSVMMVLTHLRQFIKGRIVSIICNVGEGEFEAREKLAKVMAKLSDETIVTYGVSKGEDLDFTVNQFCEYLKKYDGHYTAICDRREAIDTAIKNASDKDCVVILGRADEDGMYVDGKWIEVDDRVAAKESLESRGYR